MKLNIDKTFNLIEAMTMPSLIEKIGKPGYQFYENIESRLHNLNFWWYFIQPDLKDLFK